MIITPGRPNAAAPACVSGPLELQYRLEKLLFSAILLAFEQQPLARDFRPRFAHAREHPYPGGPPSNLRGEPEMRRSDLVRHSTKGKALRTSQIVFGERQHLLRVLDSVERSALPAARLDQERRVIEQLIHARTQELNRINAGWGEKVGVVLSAEVKPESLDQLSRQAPKEDFYLLRLISEHPKVAAKTLARLSHHPYSAIRENIARHPNSDASTLSRLSRDRSQPLWYLVAFNPNAPAPLRKKLQERMRRLGEKTATQ